MAVVKDIRTRGRAGIRAGGNRAIELMFKAVVIDVLGQYAGRMGVYVLFQIGKRTNEVRVRGGDNIAQLGHQIGGTDVVVLKSRSVKHVLDVLRVIPNGARRKLDVVGQRFLAVAVRHRIDAYGGLRISVPREGTGGGQRARHVVCQGEISVGKVVAREKLDGGGQGVVGRQRRNTIVPNGGRWRCATDRKLAE